MVDICRFLNEIANRVNKADKFAGLGGTDKKDDNKSIFGKEEKENGVNGKLDEPVYQGEYGDCWLLSGLLSMSYRESGAKVIEESKTANN